METLLRKTPIRTEIFLAVLAGLLFLPFLGQAHLFDWDEINFAEAAREMLATGNYTSVTIDYQPFWEKPPLFLWMQMVAMKLFGVGEYAARFPNAVAGILTVILLFQIGKKLRNEQFGLVWSLLYMASILPHFYFKSGIIDPWFNLFIFLGVYRFLRGIDQNSWKQYALAGLYIGLATLTKGPVAILIMCMVFGVWWGTIKLKVFFKTKDVLAFCVALILTGSAWFLLELAAGRQHIIKEFIEYQIRLFNTQDAGHGGPFIYHWVVLLAGCFPASMFFVPSVAAQFSAYRSAPVARQWMIILFWSVLLLFSVVKTKIVHYSSMCYFPLTFLAAEQMINYLEKGSVTRTPRFLVLLFGSITGLILTLIPFVDRFKNEFIQSSLIDDPFALQNLQANGGWTGWEALAGIILLMAVFIFFFLSRRYIQMSLIVLLFGAIMAINLATTLFPAKIEAYSQRAAIEFYQQHQGEECYIYPIGFKSYAHLFYTKKPPGMKSFNTDPLELTRISDPGVPVYFCTKINKVQEYESLPLKELFRKHGFVFYQLLYR